MNYRQRLTTVALKDNQHLTAKYVSSIAETYCIGFTDGGRDHSLDGHYITKELKIHVGQAPQNTKFNEVIISDLKFIKIETGGGCTALEHIHPHGYILITDAGDPSVPEKLGTKVTVGFYNEEDVTVATITGVIFNHLIKSKITITY